MAEPSLARGCPASPDFAAASSATPGPRGCFDRAIKIFETQLDGTHTPAVAALENQADTLRAAPKLGSIPWGREVLDE